MLYFASASRSLATRLSSNASMANWQVGNPEVVNAFDRGFRILGETGDDSQAHLLLSRACDGARNAVAAAAA